MEPSLWLSRPGALLPEEVQQPFRMVIIACQRHNYALWYFDTSMWECNQLGVFLRFSVLCSALATAPSREET